MVRQPEDRGNYVSEWFGYRVYPSTFSGPKARTAWDNEACPYLSTARGQIIQCIKSENSKGVCSISTQTAIGRRDWLVCPYRALDPNLLNEAVRRLFELGETAQAAVWPALKVQTDAGRDSMVALLAQGVRVFLYLDQKTGGEVNLGRTEKSPEFSIDVTILEIRSSNDGPYVARFGALEIQTMDFHGSYKHAVKNLKDGLRLHPDNFPATLDANQHWIADRVEGPNLGNVFKRTFYQMAFKFQLGRAEGCAGTVLALPKAVWESWRHQMGDPKVQAANGHFALGIPGRPLPAKPIAWIFSFDLDHSAQEGPDRVRMDQVIETSAEALTYWSLEVAPVNALEFAMSDQGLPRSIRARLIGIWPDLARRVRIDAQVPS